MQQGGKGETLVLPTLAPTDGRGFKSSTHSGVRAKEPEVEQHPRASGDSTKSSHDGDLHRWAEFELRIRATGHTVRSMGPGDVSRSKRLSEELASMRLNDYFDTRGAPRFRQLGLAFAAKQNPDIQDSFGSHMDTLTSSLGVQRRGESAKAYFLASEAKEKELRDRKQRNDDLVHSISVAERLRVDDVRRRQAHVLFGGIPDFEAYLPYGVRVWDLLPLDLDREEELKERRVADKANAFLVDQRWKMGKQMKWSLARSEVLALLQVANLWTKATHGTQISVGMDRHTFCRFVLDLGLIDQDRVPFFWAVSLFDEAAQPLRWFSPDQFTVRPVPFRQIVNQWRLVSVLDMILCQIFGDDSRSAFFSSLLAIARMRLPRYVIEEGGLDDSFFAQLGSGSDPVFLSTDSSNLGDTADIVKLDSVIPAWMRNGTTEIPSSLCTSASSSDLAREEQARDQSFRSMVVEPEVLHVLTQHQELFTQLHACYADGAGHMSLSRFHQFCLDFHLIPAVTSSHCVQTYYATVQCVDILVSDTASTLDASETLEEPGRRRVHGSVPSRRDRKQATRRLTDCSKVKKGTTSAPTRSSECDVDIAKKTPSCASSRQSSKIGPSSQPWRQVVSLATSSSSKRKSFPCSFGVGAFVECLCRAVFVYLGSYGNILQQGTGGYTRVLWLLTYLHYVFKHYRRALVKRSDEEVAFGPLLMALTRIPDDLWVRPPLPDLPFLGRTLMRTTFASQGADLRLDSPRSDPKLDPIRKRTRAARGSGPLKKNGRMEELPGILPALPDERPESPTRARKGALHVNPARQASLRLKIVQGVKISKSVSSSSESSGGEDLATGARRSVVRCSNSSLPAARLDARSSPVVRAPEQAVHKSDDPCVADGVCGLCGCAAGPSLWGNAECRGCSVVDVLPFDEHILRPLLRDWPGGARPEPFATEPVVLLERAAFTPPDVGPQGLFVQQPDRKSVV